MTAVILLLNIYIQISLKGIIVMVIFQAHKGVSTEYPENTMPAFEAAIRQGYTIIELDVGVTKDEQFVLLHDDRINRTGRNSDGSSIDKEIYLSDLTYSEIMQYDFGYWFSERFKGTKLALLKDVLELCRKHSVKVKIDNKYQSFSAEQKQKLFELLKPYEDIAMLTCFSIEAIEEAGKCFPDMHLHYDGIVSEDELDKLHAMIPEEQLTVWLPYQNAHTSWVRVPFADEALASMVKKYANLGIWILSEDREFDEAVRLGADVVETNGEIKPKN